MHLEKNRSCFHRLISIFRFFFQLTLDGLILVLLFTPPIFYRDFIRRGLFKEEEKEILESLTSSKPTLEPFGYKIHRLIIRWWFCSLVVWYFIYVFNNKESNFYVVTTIIVILGKWSVLLRSMRSMLISPLDKTSSVSSPLRSCEWDEYIFYEYMWCKC